MARRIHVNNLKVGELILDAVQAHHARHVLRLPEKSIVEVFDDAGRQARAVLLFPDAGITAVRIEAIEQVTGNDMRWTVASAIPKGDRADWMVEKLSELGTEAFIPLAAARSVVLPEGKSKTERWARIAIESAKQSGRAGVMRIGALTRLTDAVAQAKEAGSDGCYLSTEPSALAIADILERFAGTASLTLFVGPEGGWAEDELRLFERFECAGAKLTSTILRVETAAIVGASVVACRANRSRWEEGEV